MSKELEKQPQKSPAEMIAMAVESKADLSKLEGLLTLQERYEANEAKKAYHRAMTEFKKNAPKINKDRKVGYSTSKGNVGYSHATLGNVVEKINNSLSKYGLSASWTTSQNGQVTVTCKITHVLGYSEETSLSAPMDTSGSKNNIQAIGSTITYLERYTLLALTGLATYDSDDDGASAEVKGLNEEEENILRDWLIKADISEERLLKFLKIDSLENITKEGYKKAISVLKSKAKENNDNK